MKARVYTGVHNAYEASFQETLINQKERANCEGRKDGRRTVGKLRRGKRNGREHEERMKQRKRVNEF
jgi:hypothetical protein